MSDPAVRLVWEVQEPKERAPVQLLTEPNGDPRHRLVNGDNLDALTLLMPELEGRVTLAYLDPPFLTGRAHARVHRSREAGTGKLLRSETQAFDDRWSGLPEYLEALQQRLQLIYRTLSPDGCLVIHVDPKTSHYIKVMCDGLFGSEAFASEIIWRYRRWPAKTPNFQRVHDVLLRYTRSARPRFNQLYEPLAPSTQQTWGTGKQRAVVGDAGRRVRSSTLTEASPGAPMGDVWDISIVAPVARERTGYPTQKPEALLERLVQGLTDPGDLVLDAYAGSGTSLGVAARLNRQSIGFDIGADSLEICRARLATHGVEPMVQRVAPSVPRLKRTQGPIANERATA
jgi:site-specific DNA-methyltransferase (adenine-specific)